MAIEYTTRARILRSAYNKLGNTVLSFGLPALDGMLDEQVEAYIGGDLDDALRESRITTVDAIEKMSYDELRYENRIVRNVLVRFRNSASIFFKFSTAVDGKTVDKTKIAPQLQAIINSYDKEWSDYRMSNHGGSLWTRGSSYVHSEFSRYTNDEG